MAPRKQPSKATTSRPRTVLPLPAVRRRIWEQACDLIASGELREHSAILAGRFHSSERIINRVLVIEGIRHEREAAALRTGLLNTLEIAREAVATVDEFSGSLCQTA
jgi:hypothetical protein